MAELLGPTPGLTDEEWRKVNALGGGRPTYTDHKIAPDGLPWVNIVHPTGEAVPTHDPAGYPMRTILVSIDPPVKVTVRECDVLRLHGAPCAARSVDARAMRRG